MPTYEEAFELINPTEAAALRSAREDAIEAAVQNAAAIAALVGGQPTGDPSLLAGSETTVVQGASANTLVIPAYQVAAGLQDAAIHVAVMYRNSNVRDVQSATWGSQPGFVDRNRSDRKSVV